MTLKGRFTFISSLSFGLVSVITFGVLFLAYYDAEKKSYYEKLKNVAFVSAIYYLEKDELPSDRYRELTREYKNLIKDKDLFIYDIHNKIAYGKIKTDPYASAEKLEFIRKNKSLQEMNERSFYYGIFYPDNEGDFVILVRSSNEVFKQHMVNILFMMFGVLSFGLFIIFILSNCLSRVVYKPVLRVVDQINKAGYEDLQGAIATTHTYDEIDSLVKSYNKLLGRISENILIQQNFINYVSHEFKTPMAAISGNIEVFAKKDRSPKEYKKVAAEVLENIYHMESLLNNLLLMSGLSRKTQSKSKLRIDELLWNLYEKLLPEARDKGSDVKINLEVKNASFLEFYGNETLIYLALYNVIENAIKYSDKTSVVITLSLENENLVLKIKDKGKGIYPEDLTKIFETFYRGRNVGHIKGSGIGLSLSKAIFDHHGIVFSLHSKVNEGTLVIITFPKV
ncbi:MAG: HAMP domain-containing histidine kinase [Bergeyella sp.]|nr:HAMP domain-containing histidine kinase [Bergeyella sp.]